MPPKAKFTREEVIDAAFNLTVDEGIDALTARALAEKLNSSPRPVFTVFNNMEEVREQVISRARKIYNSYQDVGLDEENPFKGSGKGYIRFAADYPKLFQLMFMKERKNVPDIYSVLSGIDAYYEKILLSVQKQYGFSGERADELYRHMWIYSHGIAVLIATNVCKFAEEEISEMLTSVCKGLIKDFKQRND